MQLLDRKVLGRVCTGSIGWYSYLPHIERRPRPFALLAKGFFSRNSWNESWTAQACSLWVPEFLARKFQKTSARLAGLYKSPSVVR